MFNHSGDMLLTGSSDGFATIYDTSFSDMNKPIMADAEEFSQVVTQCRNIKDTNLKCYGHTASTWMTIAQCFAGVSEVPPAKGSRNKINK